LYKQASETAAILATSSDPAELAENTDKFWRLYWGTLAMVETGGISDDRGGVEGAMKRFGDLLATTDRTDPNELDKLKVSSLDLAHTCRNSLAVSWRIPDWKSPTY